ncbi:DinB family protein [Demetria terragena]|uniref:DinB family protein n=1 Tax=Demetria terragena TaxID=63959 RepID=UPI0003A55AA6|nr:DinB family protein [Demetria terragena]
MTRAHPDMWVDPEDDPRDSGETTRGEQACVLDYLQAYRLTIELKCQDLTVEQMAARSVPPSTMSLLGMIRHLARVEHHWARRVLEGHAELPRLYRTDEQPDLDFDGVQADSAQIQDAWESWKREVAHAEDVASRLTDWSVLVRSGSDEIEIRDVYVHLVEEYARHAGHADLLRECIDGRTGQ